ncbi:hypothetical protein J4471_00120 [Candidatus Woesearchaeota archaeon]|nr:hypothetical protein [Candidatus Woesearchaeota archaeon]
MPIDDYLGNLEQMQQNSNQNKLDTSIPSDKLKNYIILEGKLHGTYSYPDILVPLSRTHYGNPFYQIHTMLQKEQSFLLTMRQYVDFLKILESRSVFYGDGSKVEYSTIEKLLVDIKEPKHVPRGEWLDAVLSRKKNEDYIIFHQFENKKLVEKTVELEFKTLKDCHNKRISYQEWIIKSNDQGLPEYDISPGSLGYSFSCFASQPKCLRIIIFPEDSSILKDGGLFLGVYPLAVSSMGLRAAKLKV